MRRDGFINVFLVILVALVAGVAAYYVFTTEVKAPQETAGETATSTTPTATSTAVSCTGEDPVILSLSPTAGPVGTKLEIHGCNFSGFEGDKNAWILNAAGTKAILYGDSDSTGEIIKTTLKSKLCEQDLSYKGGECENFLALAPGVYSIYVIPWGKESNHVQFTIQ